jgi:cation:H+ antiporter
MEGAPALGVGNALGSNIANLGLVLALTALVAKLPVQRSMFRIEIPILIAVTAMAAFFLMDATLGRIEGIILLLCAIAFPFVFVWDAKRQKTPSTLNASDSMSAEEDIPNLSLVLSWSWLLLGLIALLISADQLVSSATSIAEYFNVSPLIIGVTIVAIGTSLPELATSVTSAIKGHKEMAVGNIVGSNILNILAVMAMPGLINPTLLEKEVFSRDTAAMCLITVVALTCIALATRSGTGQSNIGWKTGLILLAGYIGYTSIVVM